MPSRVKTYHPRGNIDLGALIGAFNPDAGVGIENDPLTGKPTAKPLGSKWNQMVNSGAAQELANKFNLQLAADKYGIDLKTAAEKSLIDPRKQADIDIDKARQSNLTVGAKQRLIDAAQVELDSSKNKLAVETFGKDYNSLAPEQLNQLNELGNQGLGTKISQAKALKTEADLKELSNKALVPGIEKAATTGQDALIADNLLKTLIDTQSRDLYDKDPNVLGGRLRKESFLTVSPNETARNLASGEVIEGAYEVPRVVPGPRKDSFDKNGKLIFSAPGDPVTIRDRVPSKMFNTNDIKRRASALDAGTGIGDLPTVNPAVDTSRQSILPSPDPVRDPYDILGGLPVIDRRPKIFDPVLSQPVEPATPPSIFPVDGPRITPTPVMNPYLERLLRLKRMQQGVLGNISGR